MRGKWIPILAGFVLFALAIGIVVWRGRRHPVPPPKPAAAAAAIAVAQNEVTLQGKIRPQHVTAVAASVSGFIESYLVEPGQDVYEGQVLARIGAQGSKMARDRAERASARQQTLFREGATPRLAYEKALHEYEAALKEYELIDATVRTGREHIDRKSVV